MNRPEFGSALLGHVFQEEFDGLTDILPEEVGQIGLALAGLLDGIEQPRDALLDRLEGLGRQQLPQPGKFLGAFAVIEPAVGLPLAPRLEVEPGIDQPELVAVGQQAQAMPSAPQKFQEAGVGCCVPVLDRPEPRYRP